MSPDHRIDIRSSALLFLAVQAAASLACSPLGSLRGPLTVIPTPEAATPALIATPTVELPAVPSPESGDAEEGALQVDASGWLRYRDDVFGLSFYYPPDWSGPEVHRWDAGVTAEVGTDTVYPYGTGLDERVYQVEDAYFIAVSYVQNKPGWRWEEFVANQPWMQSYLQLQELGDGESVSDARSLTIRQREVEQGGFSGIEYIATLSETAQTMTFYAREVLLFDEDLNYLRISGSPNNVAIREGEDWRAAHERVDQSFQADFYHLLESVIVE